MAKWNWRNLWVTPKVERIEEAGSPSRHDLELVVTGMVCGL